MIKEHPQIILAPMAGVTDLSFRLICKEYGADRVYSEMVSANGLAYYPEKNLSLLKSDKKDTPLIVQLFGNKYENFAQATKLISELPQKGKEITDVRRGLNFKVRRPEGIDINFGCPVKKVIKQGAGCALMKDLKLSRNIIKAVTENTNLPVSIKIRTEVGSVNALNFLDKLADLNWRTVMIHGRTFKQGFSGSVDYELIKQIKKLYPKKEVIANGGIFSSAEAVRMITKTEADGIAIARGCLGRPWIFQEIKQRLKANTKRKHFSLTNNNTRENSDYSLVVIKKIVLKHAKLVKKYEGEKNLLKFRKHLGWYFKGIPNVKKFREKLFMVKKFRDIEEVMKLI